MQIKQKLNTPVGNKTAFYIVSIAVLAALIWGVSCIRKNKSDIAPVVEESTNVEQTVEQKPVSVKKPATNTAAMPSMSYNEALKAYEGRRIQFDDMCSAVPYQHTYKTGTKIMLDNRSNVSRNITIGQTVTVPAYGYEIVTISANTFPSTILVDCGNKQNVATIIVQK